jgi:hypothetical protein
MVVEHFRGFTLLSNLEKTNGGSRTSKAIILSASVKECGNRDRFGCDNEQPEKLMLAGSWPAWTELLWHMLQLVHEPECRAEEPE